MNIAKTTMSAAPAANRSAHDTMRSRETAKPTMSAPKVAEPGDRDRSHDGPDTECGKQAAVSLGVLVEDLAREDWQKRHERHRAEAPHEGEHDESPQGFGVPRGPEPGLQAFHHRLGPGHSLVQSPALKGEQRNDDGQERESVQTET